MLQCLTERLKERRNVLQSLTARFQERRSVL